MIKLSTLTPRNCVQRGINCNTWICNRNSGVFSRIAKGVWTFRWWRHQTQKTWLYFPSKNFLFLFALEKSGQGSPLRFTSTGFRMGQWPPCVKQNCDVFIGLLFTASIFSLKDQFGSIVAHDCSIISPKTWGVGLNEPAQLLTQRWWSNMTCWACLSNSSAGSAEHGVGSLFFWTHATYFKLCPHEISYSLPERIRKITSFK